MGINYATVHSLDVYDEISLTSPFEIRSNNFDGVISPADLGLKTLNSDDLKGGETIADSAKILTDILSGNGTEAQTLAVCANAGFAIQRFKPTADIKDCIAEAKEAIDNGNAIKMLKHLVG